MRHFQSQGPFLRKSLICPWPFAASQLTLYFLPLGTFAAYSTIAFISFFGHLPLSICHPGTFSARDICRSGLLPSLDKCHFQPTPKKWYICLLTFAAWDICRPGAFATLGHLPLWDICHPATFATLRHLPFWHNFTKIGWEWHLYQRGKCPRMANVPLGTFATLRHLPPWDFCRPGNFFELIESGICPRKANVAERQLSPWAQLPPETFAALKLLTHHIQCLIIPIPEMSKIYVFGASIVLKMTFLYFIIKGG